MHLPDLQKQSREKNISCKFTGETRKQEHSFILHDNVKLHVCSHGTLQIGPPLLISASLRLSMNFSLDVTSTKLYYMMCIYELHLIENGETQRQKNLLNCQLAVYQGSFFWYSAKQRRFVKVCPVESIPQQLCCLVFHPFLEGNMFIQLGVTGSTAEVTGSTSTLTGKGFYH